MHEVAKHAGVSPMTVSRALSGDAHVQEHMRQRVQAAIKELGYSPNVSARNLAGFDDTPLATTIWPALTTIRQPVAAMARKAVELLLEEIRLRRLGETLEPLQHFMSFTLVKRDSSAAV